VAISQRTMTLDEFLRLPEEKPALEYFDGVVTQKVSPKADHGGLQFFIGLLVHNFCDPRKLARVFIETRATFAGASPVPDVSVYRWDRIPRDADNFPEPDLYIPPDIAVEIASPGQGRRQLFERCQWYVDNGSEISLLIQPRDRSISRFRAGEEPQILRGDERVDLDSVLPGFELTPNMLFEMLRLD
jgi:Uma2 family endonuclease